jgi:hypothetical protein
MQGGMEDVEMSASVDGGDDRMDEAEGTYDDDDSYYGE